ncbi:putative ascorbate-specific transmembrane electron transporter 1 [Panicum miliaceum]|uniref:Ascorbate-specific transmembrane electron transporter 1 n=1 Tax=Panicum miliaceum TaxID=4540 RepID=A0A3L6T3F1_PANMI|nr:putative ascorbate-specific transmembrane electron transporter 1 [Panicum miliaceum]
MLLGPIVLGGEAILCYRSLPLARDAGKKAHLGVYAVFMFHIDSGIPNLYSLHSWVGITAISLYALQWAAGFFSFFFSGASPATRRKAVPWHAITGLLVFVLTVGTSQGRARAVEQIRARGGRIHARGVGIWQVRRWHGGAEREPARTFI